MSTQSERIRIARTKRNLSQEDLAIAIGTNQRQISRYERGENDITGQVLTKLAYALDVSADWILGLTEIQERPIRGQGDLDESEITLIQKLREKPPKEREKAFQILEVI